MVWPGRGGTGEMAPRDLGCLLSPALGPSVWGSFINIIITIFVWLKLRVPSAFTAMDADSGCSRLFAHAGTRDARARHCSLLRPVEALAPGLFRAFWAPPTPLAAGRRVLVPAPLWVPLPAVVEGVQGVLSSRLCSAGGWGDSGAPLYVLALI